MADRRTRPFAPPTQQAGFGMMQQRLPFSAVQQHQMYPMMQQGFPTMPQGMMPQSYPAMFMAPTQPGQPPAGFVPGMMPGQQAMPPPPPYTQTLAENYRMKQQQGQHGKDQMTADQQRQSELLLRQRQFEQQQQKLRSMSALSGSKMNADSLIESILGKSKTSNCTLDTPTNISAVTATDDGFGDFMTGPTLSHDCHVTPAAPSPAMPVPTSVTTDQLAATSRVGALESDHPKSQDPLQTVNPPEPAVGEKKDQVLAMMLQCSDFSAPSKATTFVKKRPINESTPPPRVAVTFQSSQSAYRWNNSDKLTQLFSISSEEVTSPQQPVVPPNGDASKSTAHFVVPKWCTGTLPVPTIYTQVFEASTREGKIDINIVYMILIKSGLPREVLGHIWNLCNRNTPGELQMDELYLILAMIAIAQNNLSIATLDILHRCPQAPVPYLGQPVPAPPVPDAAPPPTQPAPPSDHHVPVSAPLVNMASIPEKPPSGDLSTPTVVPPVMVTPSVPPVGVTGVPSSVEENDFADFQCAVPAAESFGDFAVCAPGDTAESSATKTTSATDLIGPEDKYAALKASLEMPPQVLGAPEPPDVSTETPQDAKPSSSFADFDNAFDSSSEAKDTGDAFTANSTNPSALNPASDCLAEGFTTFQAAGSQSQASDHKKATNDKYSVLKSLVTNADLFQSEPIMPVVGSEPPSALEPAVGVDQNQGDFSTGNVSGKSEFAADNDGWDDFKAATVVKMKWSDVGGSEGAGNAVAETEANVGWETSAQMVEDAENTTMEENIDKEVQLANTIMSKVSTKPRPAKNYFARNVVRASAPVGLGISPLDTQPPDFPPDDDNDKDFDDFGTFRSSGADTSGSFSTLGCVDAFDDFGEFAKQPSVCAADSTSMSGMKTSSSHDFTGWGNQSEAIVDDVQSMKSLDFKAYPSSKTDSSASGDNQSVSSFDIATVDTARKVEVSVDDMSSIVDVVEKESMESVTLTEEENGDPGLFPNSESDKERHNDNETPQKPWDMGEMLTQGGLTALTSDRYSELSSRPQESDRHICEWTRCVDQCLKLLREANDTFNSISSSAVCHEVLSSQRGSDYIAGITEVYKVALRIGVASKSMALLNKDIVQSLKDVDLLWGNLCAFLAHSPVQPPSTNLGISDASLQTDNDNAQQAACGVCLLSVDQVSSNDTNSRQKLIYGVRQYHSSCANFWVNCVNSTLPALKIPELL